MDVSGIGPLQDFQRCVAALWRWNKRTGTHRRGAWALQQGADGYPPVQRNLAEVANGAQGMMRWRCAAVAVSNRSWLHTIASSVAMLTGAATVVCVHRAVGSHRS